MRPLRRLSAIASHYQLLLAIIQKDFDIRYAGSVLGILWTQLYPLLLLGVYTFVFSVIFSNSIPHFPLFLFVGIVIWHFFSSATQLASGSVLANANLITKVGFPRELVTISVIAIALVDLAMSHFVLGVGAVVFGIAPAWSWLALPMIIVLLAVVCLGVGLMLATAAVYLRDVRFIVEVAVLLLMFLSPVFYSERTVPASVEWLMHINPVALVITSYRDAFLDGVWPGLVTWAELVVAAVAALWVGLEVFDRGQRGFPDAL